MENLSIADYATGTLFPVRNVCHNPGCMVDHGNSTLELRWYYSEPIAIFGVSDENLAGVKQDFICSRDLLLTALRSGTGTGFPVVGEGNVMCQVLRDNRSIMALSFNDYIVLISRTELTEWLMGTFAHVPADQEEKLLDLDRLAAELLYK